MRINFPTTLGISTVFALCAFAVIVGFTNDDTLSTNIVDSSSIDKLEKNTSSSSQINPKKLPIEYHGHGVNRHHPQYPPFERSIQTSHVTVLATVKSIETRLIDTSYEITTPVMMDGFDEVLIDANNVQGQTLGEKITHLEEIVEQYTTDQTHISIHQEKKPFNYVTLHVDQYLKDETETFADELILKIPANGEGTRANENVWYQADSLEFLIGEQAMYILKNYSILAEQGFVKGEYENIYQGIIRYDIDDDNTIQSKYSQRVLESLERDEQKAVEGNYPIYTPDRHYQKMKWVHPIPLNEAIIRAENQANTGPLIVNYDLSSSGYSERWLIEYDGPIRYDSFVLAEKSLSHLSDIYDEKLLISKIESFSTYLENLPYPLERHPESDSPENKFMVHITGTWKDYQDLEIKEAFENIDGVINAYDVGDTVGN